MQDSVFVERERELEELNEYLHRALAGTGQVCFVTGQAGSGKTALVRQFVQQAFTTDPHLVLAMGSSNAQTGIGDPYLPFREALAMLTGDTSSKQLATRVTPENTNRLQAVLARSAQVLVEAAPELIGVFVPGGNLLGALGKAVVTRVGWMDKLDTLVKQKAGAAAGEPVVEQSHIFEQYTAFLQRLSTEVPLILFLDDLQWADNASLNLLFHLGRRIESSRILILGAYRPNDVALGRNGERHPLETVVHELTRYNGDVSIDLDAIPETVSRQFVHALLDAEPNGLGEAFRQALFRQTGGHALFTVELIRAMEQRGDLVRDGDGRWIEGSSLDWDALPAKVEGVIEERISRLDEELKQMLTVASVEGEQFTAEVVARVQAMSERQAIRELSHDLQRQHRLVSALGLVQFGPLRLSLYRFLHNLFQQYLYGSLGEAERAYLHRDVGEVLEALFADQTEEVAAQLARHFEEAGMPAKAAAYRLQAGTKAWRLSAHQEAVAHLTRGLELLAAISPGPERVRLELGLQTALGTVLVATHGYASLQVQRAFARAHSLARALDSAPQEIPILYGLCAYHFVRAELKQAYEKGKQLLDLAQQVGEDRYTLGGQLVMGAATLHLGELDQARQHLEQVVARYDASRHWDLAYYLGHDPGVGALSYLSLALWHQGYPDQAVAAKNAALDLARELNHPYSLGFAASFAAMLLQRMHQVAECETQAEMALELGEQGPFPSWQAMGGMAHGWAIAHQGRIEEGINELEKGLAVWEGTGAQLALPNLRTLVAEAYLAAGKREEGLKALEASFYCPEEVWWLPEQHRVHAELLRLAPGAEVEAEASLRKALDSARKWKIKSFELRAAMSLAHLLRTQGRAAEGRALLAECYAWFSEGLETPNLREARELLENLTTSVSFMATNEISMGYLPVTPAVPTPNQVFHRRKNVVSR